MKKGLYNIIEENVNIHPSVEIGNYNHIKKGTIIKQGTIIGNYNEIGNNVKINENCIIQGKVRIGDECVLEDNVTLKIGVILTKNVLLKHNSFMGPNSITLGSSAYRKTSHGTVIGDNTYIGAGVKLNHKVGEHIAKGATLFEIYAERNTKLQSAIKLATTLQPIGILNPKERIIMDIISP